MRIWMRRTVAAVLVMSLLLSGSAVLATELSETQPTQASVETVPPTEAPVEETTQAPTEQPAEEPAEPEPTVTKYEVDTSAQLYKVCAGMASELSYDQVLVYDATNDKLIFEDTREGSKLYPASVTKLFSSWVALQIMEPDEIVTVGDELKLVHEGSSVASLRAGQRPYVRNLVEGMMLPSGNDAAIVLAVAAGRKLAKDENLDAEEAMYTFVDEMNRQAKILGMTGAHFANPDGIHQNDHYMTFRDLALLGMLALEDPVIMQFAGVATDTVAISGEEKEWKNTNELIHPESQYYCPYAVGLKTGQTPSAGSCLLSAFEYEGRTYIIGVFGCPDVEDRFADTLQLFNEAVA